MPSSITLTVKQLPTSTSFFLSALQPLNYVYRGRVGNTIGFGLPDSPPDFWISQETPDLLAGAAHVAFPAVSQKKVQEFFIAALKAGGKCHGEPLLRDPSTGYYSAAIVDFDGNNIEAVYRPDLVDQGYGSRPSSISSTSSVKPKTTMTSKAPTTVSKATTVKPKSSAPSVAPSSVSKAPTQVSKGPTQVSKAPTTVSKAPTSASKSPTQVSRGPTVAPSQVSRAPSAAPTSVSQAPTAVPSQVPYAQIQPQVQAVTYTTPQGEAVTKFITQAQGAITIARQLAKEVRPVLEQSNSAPNIHTSTTQTSNANSHKPSDTIVGTLLGVAAGAALTYAFTKGTEPDKHREPDLALAYGPVPPQLMRTTTEPPYTSERIVYYQEYTGSTRPYAIEAPPSAVSSARYITLQDTDERLPQYQPTPSQRPRRRSSFSGVDVRSFTSSSRASQNPTSSHLLEAPPTSYRAPTAITMADSATSRAKTHVSSTSTARSSSESRSTTSNTRTVVPAKSATSRATATTTTRPENKPLPASRAGTSVSNSPTEYLSTHSKANKTVIGKMLERERSGGRTELTKSVVGKLEDSERLNVSEREVDPSDSVSQISSVRSGSRRSARK